MKQPKKIQFVTQPGNQRVPARNYAEAVKQAPAGETVAGIHASETPTTRGSGGRIKR